MVMVMVMVLGALLTDRVIDCDDLIKVSVSSLGMILISLKHELERTSNPTGASMHAWYTLRRCPLKLVVSTIETYNLGHGMNLGQSR
ncbi:hypothetical protein BO70DRAFT_379266 [Aspergillus heteromorphus CBS 117.55]|uniref:Secreted protein n=1 Tax=Aspergillus heteromorphus CBS 117.55 TaxID=1448321 RepID=A0A317WBY3_9EURO|nr:uncharacterized protein BO70DRAFT_379266 [Aspergillus heteromorphus CBS 117.55]PWY83455.1 hypothetical protein BO70DRAFT_379266 [Aspergillus heteromorphus CBS 117.55]